MRKVQESKKSERSSYPINVDEGAQNAACITVEDLTAIYILGGLKGFGPQKFKELHVKGVKATDVISGQADLPLSGKRADKFKSQLKTDVEKQKFICQQRAIRNARRASRVWYSTEEGKPYRRKTASNVLDRAIAQADIKRLTPHGLRHTFASLLLEDGVPVSEVSYLLGHKDSYVTLKVYTHFVRKETRAVQNLAASIMAGR